MRAVPWGHMEPAHEQSMMQMGPAMIRLYTEAYFTTTAYFEIERRRFGDVGSRIPGLGVGPSLRGLPPFPVARIIRR